MSRSCLCHILPCLEHDAWKSESDLPPRRRRSCAHKILSSTPWSRRCTPQCISSWCQAHDRPLVRAHFPVCAWALIPSPGQLSPKSPARTFAVGLPLKCCLSSMLMLSQNSSIATSNSVSSTSQFHCQAHPSASGEYVFDFAVVIFSVFFSSAHPYTCSVLASAPRPLREEDNLVLLNVYHPKKLNTKKCKTIDPSAKSANALQKNSQS